MVDTTSSYLNQPRGSKKKKTGVIIGVVILAVVVGGIIMSRQPKKTDQTVVSVVDKKELSPTEKPKIDKKSVKIQVLNGTGTPGQAGDASEALQKAGYSAENIATGNAEEFDNTTTSIKVKAGFEDVANDIKKALKDVFDDVNISSIELDKKGEYDIIVVTGGKIYEEITPTASVTGSRIPSSTPTPSPTATLTPTPTP